MAKKEDLNFDLIIAGGGAAGLCGAVAAAKKYPRLRIGIVEKEVRVGKKLLATGNGRCNFTNIYADASKYQGNTAKASPALKAFPPQSNIKFFEELGIFPRYEAAGRVYPYSNQAGAFVDALRLAGEHLGITALTSREITRVQYLAPGFRLETTGGNICCQKLILAAGGQAAPTLGGSDKGLKLAAELGHQIKTTYPALVQLKTENSFTKALKGLRFQGTLTLWQKNLILGKTTGEILFTDYGLSGIAAMSLSRFLPPEKEDNLQVTLDFCPEMTNRELKQFLLKRQQDLHYLTLENYLTGFLNKKIGQLIIKKTLTRKLSAAVKELGKEEINALSHSLKNLNLKVTGTMGWQQAQVTGGGVSFENICDKTLASKLKPGLYFAGEILDIYGDCGGYNLQWAWSSGRLAALSAAAAWSEENAEN